MPSQRVFERKQTQRIRHVDVTFRANNSDAMRTPYNTSIFISTYIYIETGLF